MHLTEKDALHNILLNKAQAQHGVYTNSPSHEMASDSFQYRDQNYDGGFYERSEDIKSNVCTDAQGLVQATKCQQQRALAEELCLRTADDYKAEILRHMRYVEVRIHKCNNIQMESDRTHASCSHEPCPTSFMSMRDTILIGQCDSYS
jgi:hypothetical protein